MTEKKRIEFKCQDCGNTGIAFQRYVRCTIHIKINEDGTLYYFAPIIDTDDCLPVSRGYCCLEWGHLIKHNGCRIETEKELLSYLENASEKPDKKQGVPEGEISPESDLYINEIDKDLYDLMDRVEEDGIVIPKSERDL